jgi:hypothetical protein
MIFETPSSETFQQLMSDPGRQEDIKKAGVISVPAASILNKV